MKKKIRYKFRNEVLKRDNHRCVICGRNDTKLDAHHITDRNLLPNGGYIKENGISLCSGDDGCHLKAEEYHISNGLNFVPGYHPDELYKLINSSYKIVINKLNKNETI